MRSKKKSTKNYLFIPIFDIAQASRSYNLETVKDACYLLHQNNHVNIWGDDYDSRAMLVQLSEEGIRAHKQSFYGNDLESFFRKGLTYVAATVMLMALIIGINKYNSNFKVVKNVLYRSTSKN